MIDYLIGFLVVQLEWMDENDVDGDEGRSAWDVTW